MNSTEEKARQFFIELKHMKMRFQCLWTENRQVRYRLSMQYAAKESNAYMGLWMDDDTGSLKELTFKIAKKYESPQCRVLRNSYYFLKTRKVCSNLSKKENAYGIIGQVGGSWVDRRENDRRYEAGRKCHVTEDEEESGHA